MAYYVDTSAFLKLVVEERQSAALRAWAEAHDGELFSADLLRTEALRAARRHSSDAVREVRRRVGVLTLIRLSRDVCDRAGYLDPEIPRSLDALHLATAMSVGDELEGVVTYDDRMADAAMLYGIEVIAPCADKTSG